MPTDSEEIILKGLTQSGKAFRPSDWAERLCGVMSAFGRERHLEYSPYVQPINLDGVRCVLVNRQLQDIEPMAFNFLLNFAKDNELQVVEAGPADGALSGEPGAE